MPRWFLALVALTALAACDRADPPPPVARDYPTARALGEDLVAREVCHDLARPAAGSTDWTCRTDDDVVLTLHLQSAARIESYQVVGGCTIQGPDWLVFAVEEAVPAVRQAIGGSVSCS